MVKPSTEFTKHHDVEAPRVDAAEFRQGWRVRTRLDQLRADGRITRGEWQAATEYRSAFEIARYASPPAAGSGVDHAGSSDAGLLAKLAAVRRLREVEATIGKLATALVVACVVTDLSWAAIARHCLRNPETVRDWTCLAIRAMAVAWATPGPRRAADPPSSGRGRPGRAVRAS